MPRRRDATTAKIGHPVPAGAPKILWLLKLVPHGHRCRRLARHTRRSNCSITTATIALRSSRSFDGLDPQAHLAATFEVTRASVSGRSAMNVEVNQAFRPQKRL
jgi:hypothetical protein